jgi:Holliday junction resolvase-like predicted endonuclease
VAYGKPDGDRGVLANRIPITAEQLGGMQFRYIKLGPNGRWSAKAIEEQVLFLGHMEVPHELALRRNKQEVAAFLRELGRSAGKASDFAREIVDFYTLGSDTIWITFHNGRLFWAIADGEVIWVGEDEDRGARKRKLLFSWRDTDLDGHLLIQQHLSSLLTKVSAYRQTICSIANPAYLRRKLAGGDDPDTRAAKQALQALTDAAGTLIAKLHEDDFETLVDMLLERQGYHRVSRLGGTQKDVDMIVEQPFTGETVFVQVKSRASQAVLDDYISRFDATPGTSRMILAAHTASGRLITSNRPDITIWGRTELAKAAVNAGLVEWLMTRAG